MNLVDWISVYVKLIVLIGGSFKISIHEQLIMADSSYTCNMTHFYKHQSTMKPRNLRWNRNTHIYYAAAAAGILLVLLLLQSLLHHRQQQEPIRHMASFFRDIVYFRIIARLFLFHFFTNIQNSARISIHKMYTGKVGFQLLSFFLSYDLLRYNYTFLLQLDNLKQRKKKRKPNLSK